MLTTFECPQCGMPFIYQSNESGSHFAAVDKDLWIDTCLDNDVDRTQYKVVVQGEPDCASQTCIYVREAASSAAASTRQDSRA